VPDTTAQGIGGIAIPARWGKCDLKVTSSKLTETAVYNDCDMKFLLDDDAVGAGTIRRPLTKMLIGIEGGILERGGLCINRKNNRYYLVELL
jgi:hypothetical protein